MAIQDASFGQEFYRYVLAVFVREGLSLVDAHDQTQETYLRAFKRRHKVGVLPGNPKAVKAWLKATAERVHIDFRRKQNGRGKTKRPVVIPFSRFCNTQDSVASDALESKAFVVKADETARMAWFELLEVRGGAEVVDAVKLVECGYTKKAIAELLGVTVRQVAMRLHLARDIVSRALSA